MPSFSNMTTTFHDFIVSDIDFNKHDLYSTTEIAESKAFMERELVIATMVNNLRYYIEGVILTPVATIGLFGKNITSNQIFSHVRERSITLLQKIKQYDFNNNFIFSFSKYNFDHSPHIKRHAKLFQHSTCGISSIRFIVSLHNNPHFWYSYTLGMV